MPKNTTQRRITQSSASHVSPSSMAIVSSDDENDISRVKRTFLSSLSQENLFYGSFIFIQLLGTLMVILITLWCNKYLEGFALTSPKQTFNYHPLFMIIGMLWLNANGMLIYRVTRTWRHKPQKLVHSAIQISSLVLSLFGLYAVFYFHNKAQIPDLYSLHSWLGITAIGGFAISWIASFVTFLYPMLSPVFRRLYLPFHTYFGTANFILCAAVAISGLTEKAIFSMPKGSPQGTAYSDLPSAAVLVNVTGITIVIFATIVVWLLTQSEFKRRYIPGVTETQMNLRRERSID